MKKYTLKFHKAFIKQLKDLSKIGRKKLEIKILKLEEDPFNNKRIVGHKLFLFRIRLSDNKREKRIIYQVSKREVLIICILDRKKEYRDLEKFLKQVRE